jgi:hypothetical protein
LSRPALAVDGNELVFRLVSGDAVFLFLVEILLNQRQTDFSLGLDGVVEIVEIDALRDLPLVLQLFNGNTGELTL